MTEDLGGGYLSGLPEDQRDELTRVNAPGLTALREYLSSGEAVAFLGAGVSRAALPAVGRADRGTGRRGGGPADREGSGHLPGAGTRQPRGGRGDRPPRPGPGVFREVLRRVLRVRTDPESGRSWTPVQELVCRCAFKAVVTTNYDPGIVDARMRVRPTASATGFMTWEDELGLDRWRTGDVFGEAELPVLFAHGQHNRPGQRGAGHHRVPAGVCREAAAGAGPADGRAPGAGSGSASPTSGSPRSCGRSPTGPAPGSTRAARRAMSR